ncbi:hypothetical protein CRUP_036208, partial [Coryphaenoides rupestris]
MKTYSGPFVSELQAAPFNTVVVAGKGETRKVIIKTGLKDIQTTERETALFEVVLSHANVAGSWLRNGVPLKPTNHWHISAKGHIHSLTVCNLAVDDTGSFTF